jgi:hypothetical protein
MAQAEASSGQAYDVVSSNSKQDADAASNEQKGGFDVIIAGSVTAALVAMAVALVVVARRQHSPQTTTASDVTIDVHTASGDVDDELHGNPMFANDQRHKGSTDVSGHKGSHAVDI